MSDLRIGKGVPRQALSQRGHTGSPASDRTQPELRLDDMAAAEHRRREALRAENEKAAAVSLAPVFRAAVALWPGGQEAYAARLGVSRPMVVDMASGKRPIGPRDWLPLKEEADAWLCWNRGVAALGGMVVAVHRRPIVRASDVKDEIAERVRRDPTLWRIVGEDVANKMGVEVGDLEDALEVGEDVAPRPDTAERLNEARP